MPDSDEYRVQISGDVSELISSLNEAGSSAEEAGEKLHEAGEHGKEGLEEMGEGAESAKEKMAELSEHINEQAEKVNGAMTSWKGLLEVIGVGATAELMEHIAETTIEVGEAMSRTSAALNVSTSDARGFNEAMESLGVSSTGAMMAIRKMQMDVENGGKHLAQLGISMNDVKTKFSDGISLFQAVIEKLEMMEPGVETNAVAMSLLGRQGLQLLGVLDEVNGRIDESIDKMREHTNVNNTANEQWKELKLSLTEIQSAWENAIISVSPIVSAALREIAKTVEDLANGFERAEQRITDAYNALMKWANAKVSPETQNLLDKTKNFAIEGPQAGDAARGQMTFAGAVEDATNAISDGWQMVALNTKKASDEAMAYSSQVDRLASFVPEHVDPLGSGKGKGKKGGGGGAMDMQQMDNVIQSTDITMQKLNDEFGKLGSEAAMAAKAGETSYAELAAQATQDYNAMKDAYKTLTDAVASGSKKAAQEAEQAWKNYARKFQEDFQQAKQKAEQDMQDIKAFANQMSSEVSGILNSAISGKLNWATEFNKIMSKMLDDLIKYVFQMVGYWASGQTMMAAAQSAAHGNMIGELAAWLAQAAGLTAANKSTQVASNAGTGASGAYSSAAQVPYIGWIIAPEAAATAYSGIMAYAAQGFDIPPGISPITQLHPREMVLPANLAEGVRTMTGSGGGGGGTNVNVNNNIQAWDGRSVMETLMTNNRTIASAVAVALRGGVNIGTGG